MIFYKGLTVKKKFSGLTCRNPVQGRLRLGSSGDKSRPRRSTEAGPGFCGHKKCLLTNTFSDQLAFFLMVKTTFGFPIPCSCPVGSC